MKVLHFFTFLVPAPGYKNRVKQILALPQIPQTLGIEGKRHMQVAAEGGAAHSCKRATRDTTGLTLLPHTPPRRHCYGGRATRGCSGALVLLALVPAPGGHRLLIIVRAPEGEARRHHLRHQTLAQHLRRLGRGLGSGLGPGSGQDQGSGSGSGSGSGFGDFAR